MRLFNPGAYAAMMAPTAATAGAYMAAGTVAAGLASGAAAGAASYLFAGGMATATGQPWEWSAEDLALSVVGGAAIGGITAGGSYVIGRGIAALRLRLAAAKAVTAQEAADRALRNWASKIMSRWDRGTFPLKAQAVEYHWLKHGAGRTLAEYTDDAMAFWNANKGQAQWGRWNPKWEPSFRLKIGNQGGYYTADGRVITYWD